MLISILQDTLSVIFDNSGSGRGGRPARVRVGDGERGAQRDGQEGDPLRQEGRGEGGEDASPP